MSQLSDTIEDLRRKIDAKKEEYQQAVEREDRHSMSAILETIERHSHELSDALEALRRAEKVKDDLEAERNKKNQLRAIQEWKNATGELDKLLSRADRYFAKWTKLKNEFKPLFDEIRNLDERLNSDEAKQISAMSEGFEKGINIPLERLGLFEKWKERNGMTLLRFYLRISDTPILPVIEVERKIGEISGK